uniref:Uncharacterized protein n=1 Tax=Gopherus agassizii TaxID=38772 RepID=A0A452GSZ5_9SAUR
MNSTRTWVHWPCEPVRSSTLGTRASLMGCTLLVSMALEKIRNGSGIGLAIELQHADQRNRLAARSDSSNVRTSPSRTGPVTFRMMDLLVSSMNSTRTWVHWPCEPVRSSTLGTRASLMGCTLLVSMALEAR